MVGGGGGGELKLQGAEEFGGHGRRGSQGRPVTELRVFPIHGQFNGRKLFLPRKLEAPTPPCPCACTPNTRDGTRDDNPCHSRVGQENDSSRHGWVL